LLDRPFTEYACRFGRYHHSMRLEDEQRNGSRYAWSVCYLCDYLVVVGVQSSRLPILRKWCRSTLRKHMDPQDIYIQIARYSDNQS